MSSAALSIKKGLALLFLGGLLALAGLEIASRIVSPICFTAVMSEPGRLAHEKALFDARDRSHPAVILLGGSDAREAFDMDQARAYFAARGFEFFNFAMSSHDPGVEKYQMLSGLERGPRDVVIYTVGYDDFIPTEEPNPAAGVWESVSGYFVRRRLLHESLSIEHVVTQSLANVFTFIRYRDPLRRCLLPKAKSVAGLAWHIYGDKPEDRAIFQANLDKYKDQKVDRNQVVAANNPRLELLRDLKNRMGHCLIFAEIPRNPHAADVYTPAFLDRHEELMKEFDLVRFADFVRPPESDYFDFNHLHSEGAKRFTEKILPKLLDLVRERDCRG